MSGCLLPDVIDGTRQPSPFSRFLAGTERIVTMTNHVRSVFLIRHGRTSYNAAHKLQGQVDIPLDAVGEWQVKQTAAALKSLYVDRRP